VAGQPVRLVDDVELVPQLRRRVLDPLAEIANIFDAAVGGGVDLDDVGRAPLVDRDAGLADVAGTLRRVGIEAVDRLGQQPGGRRLAGAAWPAEEVSVRDATSRDRVAERVTNVVLPDQLAALERLRAILAVE